VSDGRVGLQQSRSPLLQDLIVTAFGAASSGAVAVLLAGVELSTGFALYSFMLWFIIPVGAGLAGFGAAGGYFLGAKLFGHRPSGQILFNMMAVSIGTFFLIHWLGYWWLEIDGQPVRELVSFPQYLQTLLEHTSLSFSVRATKIGSTGELGSVGYVYAALQIVGFALGGFIVYVYLSDQPYCETCSKYLRVKDKSRWQCGEAEALAQMAREMAGAFSAGDLQRAIGVHAAFGAKCGSGGDHLRSTLQLSECPSCPIKWLQFKAERRSGSDWKDITQFARYFDGSLKIDFDHSRPPSLPAECSPAPTVVARSAEEGPRVPLAKCKKCGTFTVGPLCPSCKVSSA
jgi:hypothetical protein